jgi:hypothetical protein
MTRYILVAVVNTKPTALTRKLSQPERDEFGFARFRLFSGNNKKTKK